MAFKLINNETNQTFPLNNRHIFANLLDVYMEQTTASGSTEIPKGQQIQAKIAPKVMFENVTHYENMEKISIKKIVSLTPHWFIMVVKRTDRVSMYQIRVISFDFSGMVKPVFSPVVNDFQFVRAIKINSYFHMFVANHKGGNIQLFCQFKMENSPEAIADMPKDIFYNETRFKVETSAIRYSSLDVLRLEEQVCWIYSLDRAVFNKTKMGGSSAQAGGEYLYRLVRPQRVLLHSVYTKSNRFTKTSLAQLPLHNLTKKLNTQLNTTKNYSSTFCNELRVIRRDKIVLRCKMFDVNPTESTSHLVYAIVKLESLRTNKISYKLDYIFAPPRISSRYLATCFANLKKEGKSGAVQEFVIQPISIAFYEPKMGLFMLSQRNGYFQLLGSDEVDPDLELADTVCDAGSKTISLIFTRDLGDEIAKLGDGRIEETTMIFNLDSKYRANNRFVASFTRKIPVDNTQNLYVSSMYSESRKKLILASTFYLSGFKVFSIRTTVDLGYPRITLSTNSTENFLAKFKVFTTQKHLKNNNSVFSFNVDVRKAKKTNFQLSAPKNQKQGIFNFEQILAINGPLKSIQVVKTSPRLSITPRLQATQFGQLPNDEYQHIKLIHSTLFLGVTNSSLVVYNFLKSTLSYRDYSMKIETIEAACCSRNAEIYVLFHDETLRNPFRIEKFEVLYPTHDYFTAAVPCLFSRFVKPINYELLDGMDIRNSKKLIRSISDRVTGLFFYTKDIIRILIVQEGGQGRNKVIYDDTYFAHGVTVYLARDLGAMYLSSNEEFTSLDVLSISETAPKVRTMVLVIGTQTKVELEYVHFRPIKGSNTTVNSPGTTFSESQSGILNFIHCSKSSQSGSEEGSNSQTVTSICKIVVNSFVMKEVIVSTGFINETESGSIAAEIELIAPVIRPLADYFLPRYSKVEGIIESEGFIGVLVSNTVYYNKQLVIYKRGLADAWSSIFIGYQRLSTFEMTELLGGRTLVILKTEGSNMRVFEVGNMSLEVKEGYESIGDFEMFYTDFEDDSLVGVLNGSVGFAEHLAVKSNIFLYVYGLVGGFFGFFVLLWCCCCLWRCFYLCYRNKFVKREKRAVPILVKVPKNDFSEISKNEQKKKKSNIIE